MNVYVGGAKDYSAMRGPCPEGFHIPMKDEWVGVNSIMAALGNTTVNSYISKLHLHLGRFIEWQGTKYPDEPQIGYWSCTKYSINNYAYALFLYSYNGTEIVNPNQNLQKNRGFPIRPFKDTFVTPTASWTVIQGTLGSAGIFWNATEGIISITGDGTTGYTITDKDLGATTVYNSGDTKTDANCGKCYQWGNIYGFAFNSFTTSSTQVNASNYGPGNYYSSSTFITTDPRDNSNNANLWGGETGVSPAALKNAYIGEVVTETKTLSKTSDTSGSYSDSYQSLYKSGYTVNYIKVETSGKSLVTNNTGALVLNLRDTASSYSNCIQLYFNIGTYNQKRLQYLYGGSWSDISSDLGTLNSTTQNTFSMNITKDGLVTTVLNGTTKQFTLTGNSKSALNNILNGNGIYTGISSVRAENGPATVTVEYVPNS